MWLAAVETTTITRLSDVNQFGWISFENEFWNYNTVWKDSFSWHPFIRYVYCKKKKYPISY